MAFNFYGTMSTAQYDKFFYFSKLQEQDLVKRMKWLNAAVLQVGIFTTTFDDNQLPVSYSVMPSYSYAAKLLNAYKILGGEPEKEMLLRTRDMPVYLVRAAPMDNDSSTSGGYASEYSNGRLDRGNQRFDRDVGLRVERMKRWQLDVIKRKRERLEFKIKKALDYSDQLLQEAAMLHGMTTDESKSLEYLDSDVTSYMFKTGAMNVVENALDFFGLRVGRVVDPTFEDDYLTAEGRGGRYPGGKSE